MVDACSPRPTPIWLDVDTGVDDAHAILLAVRSPKLRVLGISCVSGNSSVDTVVAATLRVLDAADAPLDLPVGRGLARALVEPWHWCPQIHGVDSLGDLQPPLPPSTRTVHAQNGVQLLLDALASAPEPITVVALAPLSNIATAIRLDPDLCTAKIQRIVWMGGAAARGGNHSQWAEANCAHDPEAAHIVLTSGVPMTVYTWDCYTQVSFSRAELEAAGYRAEDGTSDATASAHRPWSSLSARLLFRDMAVFGEESAMIGDAGAVALLLVPEAAVETRRLHVAVELTGTHTRGMTVCDLRGAVTPPDKPAEAPNATVALQLLDPAALKAVFAEVVLSS